MKQMIVLKRINSLGRVYTLTGVPDHTAPRTRIAVGNKSITVDHDIQKLNQAWYIWMQAGEFVQNAFPFLSNPEREFLMTGITPDEWDAVFSKKDGD